MNLPAQKIDPFDPILQSPLGSFFFKNGHTPHSIGIIHHLLKNRGEVVVELLFDRPFETIADVCKEGDDGDVLFVIPPLYFDHPWDVGRDEFARGERRLEGRLIGFGGVSESDGVGRGVQVPFDSRISGIESAVGAYAHCLERLLRWTFITSEKVLDPPSPRFASFSVSFFFGEDW